VIVFKVDFIPKNNHFLIALETFYIFVRLIYIMTGEIVSLAVAILWAASAIFFEYAAKRIKAMNLNLIRLIFAFIFIGFVLLFISGSPLPTGAGAKTWFWMSLSGIVGFVFGDFFLFSSYQLIPSRFTQLVMTLAPLFAVISGFFILGETLSLSALIGMIVTITGIAISVLQRKNGHIETKLPIRGLLYALLAAIGQGVGLVLSKKGMIYFQEDIVPNGSIHIPIAATQIRIISGIVFFTLIIVVKKGYKDFINSFKEKRHIASAVAGSVVGPFVGVTLSLVAVQLTNTAIASTIMALVPIILIIPERYIYKRRVTPIEILGAVISVLGVALFFI
jgi:drug/metabolite transporter (DMT)-like permease